MASNVDMGLSVVNGVRQRMGIDPEWSIDRVSFFPNVTHRRGMLQNLYMSSLLRARWISEDVQGYDWNENYAKTMERKMEQLQSLMGRSENRPGFLRRLFGRGF
jgi:hypothetical protein